MNSKRREQLISLLANRDGWYCFYCRKPLLAPKDGDPLRWSMWFEGWQAEFGACPATLEHIKPRSEGGSDDLDNLLLACGLCNSRRGVKTYYIYQAEMLLWCDDHRAELERYGYWSVVSPPPPPQALEYWEQTGESRHWHPDQWERLVAPVRSYSS